jgi:hypothetical protein
MHLQEKRHHLPFREQKLHPLWDEFETTSATGKTTSIYVNQITGTLSLSKFLAPLAEPGGCLADEMVCVYLRCMHQCWLARQVLFAGTFCD